MVVRKPRLWRIPALTSLLLLAIVAFLTGCSIVQGGGEDRIEARARTSQTSVGPETAVRQMPPLDENATIDDYVTYALLNNPGLRSSYERWRAALQKVPQAKSLPSPSVGYGYFIESIETRVGPQQHRFELMQKIPFPGKLGLRGEAALAAARAARARYEQERLNLVYRVKVAFYEYYYLGQAIQVTQENLDLMERLEQVASARFKAGGAQQDVLRAQVELEKLRDHLASLQDKRGALAAQINAELNRPTGAEVPWPAEIKEESLRFSEEQIVRMARAANRELWALSSEVERSQKTEALARREFWPDFGIGIAYIAIGEARGGGMTPHDSGKDAVAAMVSVNLPIWRSGLYAGVKEARAAVAAALEARKQKENSLLSKVKLVLYNYNDAVRRAALYETTLIPKAEQALSASQAGYRAGNVDFVNLIDGERELLGFRLAHERAVANRQQSLAELEMLVGSSLVEPAGEEQQPNTAKREGS